VAAEDHRAREAGHQGLELRGHLGRDRALGGVGVEAAAHE
jgi:hypothetical protein